MSARVSFEERVRQKVEEIEALRAKLGMGDAPREMIEAAARAAVSFIDSRAGRA